MENLDHLFTPTKRRRRKRKVTPTITPPFENLLQQSTVTYYDKATSVLNDAPGEKLGSFAGEIHTNFPPVLKGVVAALGSAVIMLCIGVFAHHYPLGKMALFAVVWGVVVGLCTRTWQACAAAFFITVLGTLVPEFFAGSMVLWGLWLKTQNVVKIPGNKAVNAPSIHVEGRVE